MNIQEIEEALGELKVNGKSIFEDMTFRRNNSFNLTFQTLSFIYFKIKEGRGKDLKADTIEHDLIRSLQGLGYLSKNLREGEAETKIKQTLEDIKEDMKQLAVPHEVPPEEEAIQKKPSWLSKLWTGFKEGLSNFWTGIKQTVSNGWTATKNFFGGIGTVITSVFRGKSSPKQEGADPDFEDKDQNISEKDEEDSVRLSQVAPEGLKPAKLAIPSALGPSSKKKPGVKFDDEVMHLSASATISGERRGLSIHPKKVSMKQPKEPEPPKRGSSKRRHP